MACRLLSSANITQISDNGYQSEEVCEKGKFEQKEGLQYVLRLGVCVLW
jgi:hypothetical protein